MFKFNCEVAQSVERMAHNHHVVGSNPALRNQRKSSVAKWSKSNRQTRSVVGSSPTSPTKWGISSAGRAPVAKISYALGYEVAKQTPPELETGAFITGFRDAHAQKPAAYSEEELQAAYVEFQKEMQQKQQDETKKVEATNSSFLAENAKKEGIKTKVS